VLPHKVRQKLSLVPGTKFACRVANGSIVLTPQTRSQGRPRLVRDPASGLMVTRGAPGGPVVTSERVRAILAEFP